MKKIVESEGALFLRNAKRNMETGKRIKRRNEGISRSKTFDKVTGTTDPQQLYQITNSIEHKTPILVKKNITKKHMKETPKI